MKTFIALSKLAKDQQSCGHVRCVRLRFTELWYDWMYGNRFNRITEWAERQDLIMDELKRGLQ